MGFEALSIQNIAVKTTQSTGSSCLDQNPVPWPYSIRAMTPHPPTCRVYPVADLRLYRTLGRRARQQLPRVLLYAGRSRI
jgi:hypothetical protein